ncbi:methyltransferase (DUF5641) [Popillia japonica]|uniref:Methyltransferase (DUF5641) n=1 Tax=Popillia japonica TaxID=7064 RepID=A0AAW1N3K0_POPJA
MTQDIRKRWKKEYLSTLQQRSKWKKEHTNLEVGDLVLVTNQSTTDRWPLARVTEIQPGSDGLVRVATIKLQVIHFESRAFKVGRHVGSTHAPGVEATEHTQVTSDCL